ncbi:unnamed protein product [Trichogramma brassicae]|uniref:Uncharacterized protein n=1 Tax=Trichogramma brassicae TaxID=86971 RepID=A0A6H5IBG4_9HYME|nr:unnamed protein product [Trichogramma brassicae]
MQEMWKKNMSRAAKLVLDGEVKASEPSLEQMYEYWYPMLTAQSKKLELENTAREDHTLLWTAAPVTSPEITDTDKETPSTPGHGSGPNLLRVLLPPKKHALYAQFDLIGL